MPADDFTDPAAVHTFGHLSASIVLSRDRSSQGLYPTIDPLESDSTMLASHVVGERHYRLAREVRRTLASYEELKDIIAMLGMEELGREDQETVRRARKLERYLTQPFFVSEAFTGRKGRSVDRQDVLDDCDVRLRGDVPRQAVTPCGRLAMVLPPPRLQLSRRCEEEAPPAHARVSGSALASDS